MVGRESKYSLYDQELVTFEEGAVAYDHRDAEGFIKLNALRLRTLGAAAQEAQARLRGDPMRRPAGNWLLMTVMVGALAACTSSKEVPVDPNLFPTDYKREHSRYCFRIR